MNSNYFFSQYLSSLLYKFRAECKFRKKVPMQNYKSACKYATLQMLKSANEKNKNANFSEKEYY
jgi:hypothetical protein